MTKSPILSVDNISKSFGATQALDDIHFELEAGEIHTLVGENGAGKSTLIKILGGVYELDSGSISIDGLDIRFRNPHESQDAGIAVIPQEMQLVPSANVAENVTLGDWPEKRLFGLIPMVDRKAMHARAVEFLSQLDFHVDTNTPVDRLTFAERQLVVIAKALLCNARILVLDEPTASLEHREAERLFTVLASLKKKGVGIIYISHRLDEIVRLSDRCSILRDGKIVETCNRGEFDTETLIKLMTGRDLDELRHPHANDFGGSQIDAVVAGDRITVRKGEIVGLAGLLGSGVSKVLLHLYGATDKPAEIRINDRNVILRCPADAIAAGIGLVPGERHLGLVMGFSVRDNIALPNLDKLSNRFRLDTRQIDQLVEELMELLDIRPRDPAKQVAYLSGGNQQKVIFARWLASRVDTLLLDEPTQGIDIGAKARIHRLMREFVNSNKAILFASSESVELMNMSDTVLAMRHGKIIARMSRGAEEYNEGALRTALGG